MRKLTKIKLSRIFTYLVSSLGAVLFINALSTVSANACATMLGEYDIPEAAFRESN